MNEKMQEFFINTHTQEILTLLNQTLKKKETEAEVQVELFTTLCTLCGKIRINVRKIKFSSMHPIFGGKILNSIFIGIEFLDKN